jgi:NADPH:quinone reductase-like Zn-dependent oxidoreductase
VVIHGAAGSVGAYAVQLARRAGVRIIATAATDDIAFVRKLGADTVIDFKTQRFEEEVRDADAVIDLVGGETQRRSFQVLRRGGKLISAVPVLISILRKAMASKPRSFWSTSQASIWRRSLASSIVES